MKMALPPVCISPTGIGFGQQHIWFIPVKSDERAEVGF
jgi:hypothetical protein